MSYCTRGGEEIAVRRARGAAAWVYARVSARHAAISSWPRIQYVLSRTVQAEGVSACELNPSHEAGKRKYCDTCPHPSNTGRTMFAHNIII